MWFDLCVLKKEHPSSKDFLTLENRDSTSTVQKISKFEASVAFCKANYQLQQKLIMIFRMDHNFLHNFILLYYTLMYIFMIIFLEKLETKIS